MSSPASIAKHPIHPMLIVFPVALFIVAVLCDLAFLVTGDGIYGTVAFYCIAAGIVGGLLAAVPGFIDYLSITNHKVRQIATYHMILNLVVVALFVLSFYFRSSGGMAAISGNKGIPMTLSLIGVLLLGISGWLGGEMVYVHGVGVQGMHEEVAREHLADEGRVRP